jgi:hypothetical protein
MTLKEARKHLFGRPLRFGDAKQAEACNLIKAAVDLLDSSELSLCDECDGTGDADIPELELCGGCEGHGVLDSSGDPHKGISVDVRMAAKERRMEIYQWESMQI